MKRAAAVVFCVGLMLAAGSRASAATIIASNLNASQDGYSFESLTYWEADSFITPGGIPYFATAVIVPVALFAGPTDFSLEIYTDSAGLPGTSLGSFTPSGPIPAYSGSDPPAFPFSFTTFTATGSVILQPNTTYWLGANVTTGTVFWAWNGALVQNQEGLGTVTGLFTSSGDQGTTWATPSGGPNIFQVEGEGTPVPEPGTLLLLGTGLGAVAARRRRIRAR